MKISAFLAIAAGLFAATQSTAFAQTDAPSARDMKGSPNAAGFGKDNGPPAPAADDGSSGKAGAPSATNMKGSPNANGFGK